MRVDGVAGNMCQALPTTPAPAPPTGELSRLTDPLKPDPAPNPDAPSPPPSQPSPSLPSFPASFPPPNPSSQMAATTCTFFLHTSLNTAQDQGRAGVMNLAAS